jgi:predicted N-acetyltransferase YhbS
MLAHVDGTIERLTTADLEDCLALAREHGWPREERKWRLLLEVGTGFARRDEAGRLIATVVLTPYGARLAVIGMMLVAARHGRRGLGRALMHRALETAAGATVVLHATDQGVPLYLRLGFTAVGTTHTHTGAFTPASDRAGTGDVTSRPARPGDLASLAALDAAVTGGDRTRLVQRLPGFATQLRVIEERGVITGYAGAWRNDQHLVIGPVIAEHPDHAKVLISDLAATTNGQVRLDLDGGHPALRDWATSRGVLAGSATTVMVRGAASLPGDRSRWFLPVMQALG